MNILFDTRLVSIKTALDLIGHMGDHLHRASPVIPVPLLVEDRPVDFAAGHIGIEVQVLIDKPLIVAQIQVCLRPVLGHKDLPVLDRVHSPRIHIQIGIQFLHGDAVSARLEQAPQGGCRNSLSKTGDDTSGDKNISGHGFLLSRAINAWSPVKVPVHSDETALSESLLPYSPA